MTFTYRTSGTCSSKIHIELDGDKITSVKFDGGCNGNLNGISKMIVGMDAHKVIDTFSGIRCGFKQTSCPDQLARALTQALQKNDGDNS